LRYSDSILEVTKIPLNNLSSNDTASAKGNKSKSEHRQAKNMKKVPQIGQ